MPKPNFEVIQGGASEEGESLAQQEARERKEARMNETRVLSDAEFIKGGARMDNKGSLHVKDEQIAGMKDRLKRVESVIENLENHWYEEGMDKLREQGEKVSREMRQLHTVSEKIKLNEWFVTHNAAQSGEVREDGVKDFKENEEKFKELRNRLGGFFSEVQQFADKYGISHLGGLSIGYQGDANELKLAENIGAHFESPDELLNAIEQVRDAKLYRAHAEKKEITGSM